MAGRTLQPYQIHDLFAVFIALMGGMTLLLIWRFNRSIQYLRYFAYSLFCFVPAVVLCQIVFEKMTFGNAIAGTISYFAVSGFMAQAALSRLGEKLNLPLHLSLMALDMTGRIVIIQFDFSASAYLIYVNTMMAMPLVIAVVLMFRHPGRDMQTISLIVAYSSIAAMAIILTPVMLSFGPQMTGDNYFSSYYWMARAILTVFGIGLTIAAFAFTLGRDLLLAKEEEGDTDFLSGLLTRRAFDKKASELLVTNSANNEMTGLMTFDIDHFKEINDAHGHLAGDQVISAIGTLVQDNMPEGAIAGRLGGEEFGLILSPCDIRNMRMLAEGLRTSLSALTLDDLPEDAQVTASFGVTVFRAQEQQIEALKRADEALYEAKNSGRNKVVAFCPYASNAADIIGLAPAIVDFGGNQLPMREKA